MDGEVYNINPYPYTKGRGPIGDEYHQEMERALRGSITDSNFMDLWPPLTTDLGEGDNLSPRESLLREAIQITTTGRNVVYGEAEQNHQRIADFWNLYLTQRKEPDLPISATDAAIMMILLKIARLQNNVNSRDGFLDIAGYAAVAWETVKK